MSKKFQCVCVYMCVRDFSVCVYMCVRDFSVCVCESERECMCVYERMCVCVSKKFQCVYVCKRF